MTLVRGDEVVYEAYLLGIPWVSILSCFSRVFSRNVERGRLNGMKRRARNEPAKWKPSEGASAAAAAVAVGGDHHGEMIGAKATCHESKVAPCREAATSSIVNRCE